jgi:hypothetical protein
MLVFIDRVPLEPQAPEKVPLISIAVNSEVLRLQCNVQMGQSVSEAESRWGALQGKSAKIGVFITTFRKASDMMRLSTMDWRHSRDEWTLERVTAISYVPGRQPSHSMTPAPSLEWLERAT